MRKTNEHIQRTKPFSVYILLLLIRISIGFPPHPVSGAEVNGLREVVALVEAAVIGPGEGHHKLPCTLIGPVHLREEICTRASLITDMDHAANNESDLTPPNITAQTTYGDAVLHEDVGIHDGDQLMEEIRLGVKQLWSQLFHHGLKLFCRGGRHSVPRLRFTPGGQRNELTFMRTKIFR